MNKSVTEVEIERAYLSWRYLFGLEEQDELIQPFLKVPRQIPTDGCLKTARQALMISSADLAARLNINRKSLLNMEKRESDGSLQIKTLKKVAEVMDCELVYAIRPKSRKAFSKEIWDRVLPDVLASGWMQKVDDVRRTQRLIATVQEMFTRADFRRRHKISERFQETIATRRL